ncbi:hypothetical protein ACIA5D_36755 [Actinoplanes sp. NPDC051513]|uniref:hypothetical protein n=1 Tax=Actinoplanes sp. NPDC051513 TaxID=3363908 RepID=UPI0037ADD6A1
MTDPSALKPGDLIFMADSNAGEVFPQHLFTVDENRGPVSAERLAREDWGRGWHSPFLLISMVLLTASASTSSGFGPSAAKIRFLNCELTPACRPPKTCSNPQ